MRYLIISDIHGSMHYLNKVIKIYEKTKCQKLIILGDVLYHGPRNNLPKGYNPKEVIKILNSYKNQIICVQGNCDAEVDQMVLQFPINKSKTITNNNLKVFLTHGHKYNPQNPLLNKNYDIVLFGHSHIHEITKVGNTAYINPGSISLAKGDLINSFAIWENETITIYDLKMHKLMAYEKM